MFKRVYITSRLDLKEAIEISKKIFHFLERRNITVTLEEGLASKLGEKGVTLDKARGDLVIIVGGDGTVLRIVHMIGGRIPLYVIKFGRIGFFADGTPENALMMIEKVLDQKFVRDKCIMLSTNLGIPNALNEIRIGTVIPRQMMEMSIYINGLKIAKDRLDAIVIATPVGASAYALSAGANVLDPRVEAILIVPICPLSPNFKPFIVPSSVEISVRPESNMEYTVLADGYAQEKFRQPLEVKIHKSNMKTVFLRTNQNFYERLKRRLNTSSLNF